MKPLNFFLSLFLFLFATSHCPLAMAADHPSQKLTRGLVNVFTSPLEFPKEFRAHWIRGSEKTYHISAWLLCGVVKGLVMVPARLASGIWDVVTFPVPVPKDYEPLLKPEYIFQNWPHREDGVVYKNLGDPLN